MRVSALMARTPAGFRAAAPLGVRKALEVLRDDRRANGEAFALELVVRLPRRFSRAHRWRDARGPGLDAGFPASWTMRAVERALRAGEPLPFFVPASIGLRRAPPPAVASSLAYLPAVA